MPVYVYQCDDCTAKYDDEQMTSMNADQTAEAILFETFHSMNATKKELAEATVCPRCNGINCKISMYGVDVRGYMRGYGWRDKAGARRDMNVYHLDNQDPYSKHRVAGEVEHIRSGLKAGGKHNPRTKFFGPSKTKKSDEK